MTPRWWSRVRGAFHKRKPLNLPDLWKLTDEREAAEARLKRRWSQWL